MQHITPETYSDALKSAGSSYVLYFSASWCGPCNTFRPRMDQISIDRSDDTTIFYVDVDTMSDFAQDFNIKSVPTTLGIANGKEVSRFTGLKGSEFLNNFIDTLIA